MSVARLRRLALVGSVGLVAAILLPRLFPRAEGPPAADPAGAFEFGGGYPGGGMLAAFSPDGKTVYVGGPRADLTLLDAATGRRPRALTADPEGGVAGDTTALAVSPDGKTVATCIILEHQDRDPRNRLGWELRVWDTATGRVTARHRGDRWQVNSLAFNRDGKLLAGATGKDLLIWAAPDWAVEQVIQATGRVAFTPDGDSEVLNGVVEAGLRRWNPVTGRELPSRHEPFGATAISPDGKTQANLRDRTDQNQQAVTLIDLPTSRRKAIARQPHEVRWLAFNSDGTAIATVSPDATAVVWDAATLTPKATLPLPGPRTYSHYGPRRSAPTAGPWSYRRPGAPTWARCRSGTSRPGSSGSSPAGITRRSGRWPSTRRARSSPRPRTWP